ncbi:MAG TPA: hypothetical protein DCL16_11420 [Acidimicrobiaceae bacterium]|nr:hypothetical protein [Acidimicrobiaceae bacterium]
MRSRRSDLDSASSPWAEVFSLFRLAIRMDDHPATAAVNTQSMLRTSETNSIAGVDAGLTNF